MRYVAIDWSGAKTGAERKIWLAEAAPRGLLRLECGRTREAVAEHLIDLARQDEKVVIGFDFGFSAPAWFLRSRGLASAPELWALAARECEDWLASKAPPWWGGGRGGRPSDIVEHHRKSDLALPRVGGIQIKSVFQVGGSGSVGTGSLRGWPILHRLREADFAVWPFDPVRLPLIVEIYPRLLTGAVNKSRPESRSAYLAAHYPDLTPSMATLAASTEDAFDAAVSALVMAAELQLDRLVRIADDDIRLEGVIWHPALDLASSARPSGAQP